MCEDLIRRILGEASAREIQSLGEGEDSVALLVDGETVFRIGKSADIGPAFDREAALLPQLRSLLDLQVPEFIHHGKDSESGLPYVAYTLIKGADLTPPLFRALDETAQERVLEQIAAFLDTVNGMSLDVAHDCGIALIDPDGIFNELLDRVRYRLYPQMGADGQGYIDQIFERFADRNPNLDQEPALLHADLSAEHMIFAEGENQLVGIIDFGDLCISDPDYEYHWLYDEFGRDFVARLAEKRGQKLHRQFHEKQQAFIAANVLDDVLKMEKKDYRAYRRALETINRGDFGAVYEREF